MLRINSTVSGYGGIPSYQRQGKIRNYYHYVAEYDGEIRYFDEHFERLINAMREMGFYDDSLIIFTSDHGEGMGEHDYYFAHGENLLNCLTKVPLIVRHGNELKGRRMDFVQHLDIVPTVLQSADLSVSPHLRGSDLRAIQPAPKEIISARLAKRANGQTALHTAIVSDGFKLLHTPLSKRPGAKEYRLFNLRADPREEHDLAEDPAYKSLAKELRSKLSRAKREDRLKVLKQEVTGKRSFSQDDLEKLKALGYVQ